MQLYYIDLNLTQLQMDMSRLPQHVENEFQAFKKLLCLSAQITSA